MADELRAQLALLAGGVRDTYLLDSPAALAQLWALPPRELAAAGVGVLQGGAFGGNRFLVHAAALAHRAQADAARAHDGERVVVPVRAPAAARRPYLPDGEELHAWLQRLAHCLRALSSVLLGGAARVAAGAALAAPAELPLCPVALTGYLLGYPVVYDVSSGSSHSEPGPNCLGGSTLQVHRMQLGPAAAVGFSVPAERDTDGVYAPAAEAVAQWGAQLLRAAERAHVPATLTIHEVVLGAVAL